MIIERTESEGWLSNAYLVADREGGHAVLIDGNGVTEALLDAVERLNVVVDAILLTHHHGDHLAGLDVYKDRFGGPLIAHAKTAQLIDEEVQQTVEDGERLQFGGLRIDVLHTPGHAAGHVAFVVNGYDCFTGDVLFKGTVGGTMAPGATGFADLRTSIMDGLMELPGETRIHPGHRAPSTIGTEAEANPFIRIWRGLDPEGDEPCRVWGEQATLVLWAPDYDGTNKAWIRWAAGGEDIVGGSQVERG